MSLPVSTIILTKDEERDLPLCLESLSWCDDIHVVDSGSNDRTTDIALGMGAKVSTNVFVSFGHQRNWSLDNCKLAYQWVLFLDADECSTLAFEKSVEAAISTSDDDIAGFYCCWKLILDDRWLRFSGGFPKWQFRLLRQGKARFCDHGHGQKEDRVEGKILYIKEPYLHFAFSKGWSNWIQKHNRYSDQEAIQRSRQQISWADLFSFHGSIRNKALKPLVSSLPGWPVVYFLVVYLFKLGFLDGTSGLVYCLNMSWYEYLIQIKISEINRRSLCRQ